VDIAARFAEPLRKLAGLNFLSQDGDWLNLSRDGLLQVDKLVHEFFLPEHRHARYA
jgi:oxygen-independent coproporphyrinogen-3 oxidase